MKICPYHRESLRTALSSYGLDVRDSTGHRNPLFLAESAIYSRAIEEYPDLVDTPACPICTLIAPSWIEGAAKAIVSRAQEDQGDDRDYQRNPS